VIREAFTEHPASVGESYSEHMGVAIGFGWKMIASGLACVLHGVFPFMFKTTGSKCIKTLHDCMANRHEAGDVSQMPPLDNAPRQVQAAE